MDRRSFVKTLSAVGLASLPCNNLKAEENEDQKEFVGMLVDTTYCAGCRSCEFACAESNGFPEPDPDDSVFEERRKTSIKQYSLVNRYDVDGEEIFVKTQCMHCNQPACASACLTSAMLKTKEGPVIWREGKCMGCRYCMLSCPFDVPKYEYNEWNPKVRKCNLCWSRLKEGEIPACADACPAEAIKFGKRSELLEEARKRIYTDPDSYYHHIYGEHEAGGTGYLYLASVPFEKIGFKTNIGTTPYPEYTKDFLYAVPIILALWPPLLLALNKATKKEDEEI
jgi:Fe-S-cluster-containing dehydrogenase component